MRKYFSIILGVLFAFGLTGCGQTEYPNLPDNSIAFEMGEYVDTEDNDVIYGTIMYQGRTYMPYGTLSNTIDAKDINSCIGYMVQDGNADTDERLYTLASDGECNYLMEYYVADNMMNQPYFWRAIDTRGEDISTPDYIDSLEYQYWNYNPKQNDSSQTDSSQTDNAQMDNAQIVNTQTDTQQTSVLEESEDMSGNVTNGSTGNSSYYGFDEYFKFDSIDTYFEVHVAGIDGECFTYSIYFDDGANQEKADEISIALDNWVSQYGEESYVGYIDVSLLDNKVFVYLDLGGTEDCDRSIYGVVSAVSGVQGIKEIIVNEDMGIY